VFQVTSYFPNFLTHKFVTWVLAEDSASTLPGMSLQRGWELEIKSTPCYFFDWSCSGKMALPEWTRVRDREET
jgi:hypothetical protein